MLEVLLGRLHPSWHPYTEVAVRRPSRGWIDAALHDPRESLLVATELQSELRRLEQIIRWSAEKAASLPSWDGWTHLGEEPQVSRPPDRAPYPGNPCHGCRVRAPAARGLPGASGRRPRRADGHRTWPGPALVWAMIDGERTRLGPGRQAGTGRRG